ncbi:MAG: hypothetical protein JWR22_2861 [Herminiimonas sp.]|nr:hypothetical protein [Herminiimonas sp.]
MQNTKYPRERLLPAFIDNIEVHADFLPKIMDTERWEAEIGAYCDAMVENGYKFFKCSRRAIDEAYIGYITDRLHRLGLSSDRKAG